MTWILVVGALVAVGLALHFAEERSSKAKRARMRSVLQSAPADLQRFTFERAVDEEWVADLETLSLSVTRKLPTGAVEPSAWQLERDATGWYVRAARQHVPLAIAGRLEAQYQRYSANRVSKALPEADDSSE